MSRPLKIIVIVTAIALALAVTIFMLFFKKGKDELLFKIPSSSRSAIIINVKSLSTDFFLDYILGRDLKSRSRLTQNIPDWLKNIDWTKSGIGLPDKMALFSLEDTVDSQLNIHFMMPVSNADRFQAFMDTISSKLQLTVNKKRGIKWIYSKPTGFLMAWDAHFVTGINTPENAERKILWLYNILNTSREQSIMTDHTFSEGVKKKYDVFFYTTPYRHCPFKKLEVINANITSLSSFINFKDGEFRATTEINAKSGSDLENIFIDSKEECPGLTDENKAMAYVRTKVNPAAFRSFYAQFRMIGFKPGNIPALDAWDGRLSLLFNGTKTIENTFISYEYDNDFNKIEIRKVKKENIFDIRANAGVKVASLDSLWRLSPPVKDGADTLLFNGGRYLLKRNRGLCIFYNKEFPKPQQQSATLKNNIEITIDYKRLSPMLKEMGMGDQTDKLDSLTVERFNLSAYKQGNIKVKTSITFKDKDINAFFTLLEKGISMFK